MYNKKTGRRLPSGLRCIGLQENVLQDEQNSQNIHQRRNLLALAGDQVQDHVGNDAQGDAFGDAVEQGHCQNGQVSRNGLGELVIVKLQLGNAAEHQEADHDQSGSGSEGRNSGKDGSESSAS